MPSRRQIDEQLAMHLAAGVSVQGAAELTGVDRSTVFRRLKDETFRARIGAIRAEMLDRAFGDLSKGLLDASRTLRSLLLSEEEKIRLAAGRSLLDFGVRFREAASWEARIENLERLALRKDE
ncbi:MAG: hypothetical protein ACYC3I_06305 [Gemmataceae bacterium]